MTRKLPPLNALKAFEAAARTGGFVPAARELRVSPAAVSQQVKNLERFFDKRLFVRHHNRLSLTDAGLAVFADSSEALERLAAMTLRTFEGEVRSRLVVSVLPSVASHWLNRRLNRRLHRPLRRTRPPWQPMAPSPCRCRKPHRCLSRRPHRTVPRRPRT